MWLNAKGCGLGYNGLMLRSRLGLLYHIAVAAAGLLLLVSQSALDSLTPHLSELFIFLLLSLTVKRAGFHVAPQVTHSLVGIVDVAALMIFGPAAGGWVAALSGFVNLLITSGRSGELGIGKGAKA